MKTRGVVAALFLLALIGIGSLSSCNRTPHSAQAARQVMYHCPMHPQYHSDKPGNCPICQMTLVRDEKPSEVRSPKSTSDLGPRTSDAVPGQAAVHVPGGREQRIGVKLARAEVRDL